MLEETLKSGKKVALKEITALEEVLAYQILGKAYDEKNMVGTAALHRSVLTLLSIEKIDDVDFVPPKDLPEAFAKLKTFGKRDWAEIGTLYSKLNDVDMGE